MIRTTKLEGACKRFCRDNQNISELVINLIYFQINSTMSGFYQADFKVQSQGKNIC